MGELETGLVFVVLLFLIFPLAGGVIASALRISPLLGYVLGGVFLGQLASHLFNLEYVSAVGNIGLILLLFTIGLEVRLSFLKRFGKKLALLGLGQILGSFSVFFIVFFMFFGYALQISLVLAAAFCISSTAVVAKILQEKAEESSLIGSLSLGVLIMQDLALIPLLILANSIGKQVEGSLLVDILIQFAKAGIVLLFIYYVGQRIVPFIFNFFAKFSREILNLFTITFVVVNLYLFTLLELSPLIAAFLAGVLLAQTLEHQHIFSEIRPFRDFFSVLFFSMLGVSFPLDIFVKVLPFILFMSLLIAGLKIIIILSVGSFIRFHSRTSFALALNLFQVGEGAFIILSSANILPPDLYAASVGSVIVLLLATPILMERKDKIYVKLKIILRRYLPAVYRFISLRLDQEFTNINILNLKNHIIVCGYGRVGSYVGRALQLVGQDFIAVDSNFNIVEKARKQGINIVYGDPTNPDVLDYLDVEKAGVLISAVPSRFDQELIITQAKNLNPRIKIFSRVHSEQDMHRLKELGAEIIIHPEFEASLSIVRKILIMQRLPKEQIKSKLRRLKIEHWL